jgi:Family of unknown function (DUF5681)
MRGEGSEMEQDDETLPNKTGRGRDGRFKRGQSGNPGGRPKIFSEVKQAAREHTEAAIETLASAMNNEKATAAVRMAAGVAILGWIARRSGKLTEIEFAAAISAMRYVARRQLSARRARRSPKRGVQ